MGLFAVAVYLLIALFSYHPDDPGWSHSISVDTIHNSAGVVGAWLSDVLLYLFGYFGYVFPIVILVSSWRLLQLRKLKQPFNSFHFSLHTIGLILSLISGCGLAWMHFKAGGSLPHEIRGAGGILGDATGSVFSATFGYLGSSLLLLVMLPGKLRSSWLGLAVVLGCALPHAIGVWRIWPRLSAVAHRD